MTADDQHRLAEIMDTHDPEQLAVLVFAYYDDGDRAERTPRTLMYLHIGMLIGAVMRLVGSTRDLVSGGDTRVCANCPDVFQVEPWSDHTLCGRCFHEARLQARIDALQAEVAALRTSAQPAAPPPWQPMEIAAALERVPRFKVSEIDDMLLPNPVPDGDWVPWTAIELILKRLASPLPSPPASAPQQEEKMNYRKKPVVIQAFQWTGDFDALDAWLNALGYSEDGDDGLANGPAGMQESETDESVLLIPTLEGEMKAQRGDWIIRGIQGEFYPCKPDIFAATYEPAIAPAPQEEQP